MALYTVQSPIKLYLKGKVRFRNPEARYLGTFESNYKMAASKIKVSARSRRSYGGKGDCEQSINVIIDCN